MARGRPKAVEHEGRCHVYERELRATTTDGVPLLLREPPPRVMSCCWTTASTLRSPAAAGVARPPLPCVRLRVYLCGVCRAADDYDVVN